MDVIGMGAKMLSEQLGLNVDSTTLKAGLVQLLGGDGQGGIDLAGLASKMASSGELSAIVNSWLGDGANTAISAENILKVLGESNVSNFARTMGTDTGSAADGLSDVLPEMMDKASSGGNLLDAAGGLGGLLDVAKSFLK